jgi:Ca-activated chloride channel family protein
VLVHQREAAAKADKVPALRKVPQVLAAGWGGVGMIAASPPAASHGPHVARMRLSESRLEITSSGPSFGDAVDYGVPDGLVYLDGIDGETGGGEPVASGKPNLTVIVAILNARYPEDRAESPDLLRLQDLASIGLGEALIEALRTLVGEGCSEERLVVAVLSVVAASPAGQRLSRNARRVIRRAGRVWTPPESLLEDVSRLLLAGH